MTIFLQKDSLAVVLNFKRSMAAAIGTNICQVELDNSVTYQECNAE